MTDNSQIDHSSEEELNHKTFSDSSDEEIIRLEDKIPINISVSPLNHKNCVICHKMFNGKVKNSKQKNVGTDAILAAYIETGIYIPKTSRSCIDHFIKNSNFLKDEALKNLSAYGDTARISIKDASELIEGLRAKSKKNCIFQSFEDEYNVPNELCLKTTGLSTLEFAELCQFLNTMRNSLNRTKSKALAIYLFWLKTGVSQKTISAYFDTDLTQQNISNICDQVRNELAKNFVSKHLDVEFKRDELCMRNSEFVKYFCENEANESIALIADATYLYCNKSSNNQFQRMAYSVQKNVA